MFGCLNHEVPLTSGDNASVTCETGRLGCACVSCHGRGGHTPHVSGKKLGGRRQRPWGHLASEPDTGCSVPVTALLRGRGCPLPCSPRALPARRVSGRLPALRQCHSQPQPTADPLPPDGQLVPEPALALCHGARVRAPACPLPARPEGMSPPRPASVCAVGLWVCLAPALPVTAHVCARGFTGCVSLCECLRGHGRLYLVSA